MLKKIELSAGPFGLELLPEVGGAIGAFELNQSGKTFDIMRRALYSELSQIGARATACFPLVPFSNRVCGGTFIFQDQKIKLSPNMKPHHHPLHGHGWRESWEVESSTSDSAELVFQYEPGEWPWRYEARQQFELTSAGLNITISLQNQSDKDMPAGIGIHPYFNRTARTELDTSIKQVWLSKDYVPQDLAAMPEKWNFEGGRVVEGLEMDHCFSGWDHHAVVRWPEKELALHIEPDPVFRHVVIFIPADELFFCFEPVTNIIDAFNAKERGFENTGVTILPPGGVLSGGVQFRLG